MELNIYSIKDSAAEAFVTPFFMQNDGLAIRAFQDNVNSDQENNISKHPEQFALYKTGTFNDKTGTITALEQPQLINRALELKTEKTYTVRELETVIQKYITK